MSALFDSILPLDHTPAELAALDLHAEGRRVRCAPPVEALTQEMLDGADDMGEWADHQRHQVAKFEAAYRAGSLRGLPSVFGAL